MKGKGGFAGVVITILIVIATVVLVLIFKDVSYQHGTTKDYVFGYDKGLLWYHAYLTHDIRTAYCFDDERFTNIFDKAQSEGKQVLVTYEKYIGRGIFCSYSEGYEGVIIKEVSIIE